MADATYWINKLALTEHPEGGYFKETYRSPGILAKSALPATFQGDRSFSTSIYFLLKSENKSFFHRIQSDELWHFHAGSSLSIYVLQEGKLTIHKLGDNPDDGESLQVVVPAFAWFGACVNKPNTYTLSGCTVAPGFDFTDFELAEYESLQSQYPTHTELIKKFTPQ